MDSGSLTTPEWPPNALEFADSERPRRRDGTDWRRHTYDEGMNWHPVPAPDGRHYVYVKALGESNWEIFLGDLAGGAHRRLTHYDGLDILAHVSPDGKKMNWGRSTGGGFMQGIRTFVMDVSSLDLGPEKYVPFNPAWGRPMGGQPAGGASRPRE